jgi:LytS/YehU family sensor histidine kinase
MRASFVPSLGMATFLVFNTVYWLVMAMVRYEFSAYFNAEGGNALSGAVVRGCCGWLTGWAVHLILSRPGMLVRPLLIRVGVGMVISIFAALAFFVVVPSLQAPVLTRQVITLLWCAIYFGLEANHTRRRAEREAAESVSRAALAEAAARHNELRRLEAQMNPHFLFNALNCVVAASRDHVAVERVTQDLADYLRFSLAPSQPLEPLSREIDALEKYLAIQQSRFGADLVCRISCEPEARRVLVPPMMIQPLLENAFHYGPQTSPMPLNVSVEASVRDGQLAVIVANSGSWVPPDPARSIGSGIQTLRKRLGLLLGPAASVEVVHEQGWVKIVIRLPDSGPRLNPAIPPAIQD